MKKLNVEKLRSCAYILFLALLVIYPLRHVNRGVDLWDGGYNYANFIYSGICYMDSAWYFATWIATEAGALIMRLPFADTMLGANICTGLIVSLLAVSGFLFCTKALRLPARIAFLGELASCSLCWAPTSVLYTYLTFLLLMFGAILLYLGLVSEKAGYLAASGVLLGLNVGVRFSNLAHAGLIVAVWLYCTLKKKTCRELFAKTVFCFGSYLGGMGLFLAVIAVKYGLREYFEGITGLFAMTRVAKDYAPAAMLRRVFGTYFGKENRYWIKRFGLALVLGTGICLPAPRKAVCIRKLFCVGVTGALFYWLLTNLFFYPDFASYDSITAPCVMLLLLSLAVSVLFLFRKDAEPEDKLLAVLEILMLLLVPIGGNNGVFYNINNMFLTLPFLMLMLWKSWKKRGDMFFFTLNSVTTALVLLVCILALCFGQAFSYEEASGGRSYTHTVTGIPVLRGMRTSAEKAERMEELYVFLNQNGLQDRKYILYGGIPGISYYMELEPALNIWADLRSYRPDIMQRDLEGCAAEEPIVILDREWACYLEHPGQDAVTWDETALQKAEMLKEFMVENGYVSAFHNEKYVLYEKKTEKR